jgi:hypothetical protein
MAYQLLQHRFGTGTTKALDTGDKSKMTRLLRWYANFYDNTFWRKVDESELSCTLVRKSHTMKLEVVEVA